MTFALGCRRDDEKRRTQKQARGMLHAVHLGADMPDFWSLERFEAPILDQTSTSSCTSHGTAQILFTNAQAASDPLPFLPSCRAIYSVTRSIERLGDLSQPLADSGAFPGDVMKAIAMWGISPSRVTLASDVDASNVNNEVDLMALEQGAVNLVAPEYRIDEFASDLVLQVKQALVAGYTVGVSFFADEYFMEWKPGMSPCGAPNQAGPGGGHWSVLSSYAVLNGVTTFRGPGSWGPSYGDTGHHYVNEAWLASAWDCYTGPTPRRAA